MQITETVTRVKNWSEYHNLYIGSTDCKPSFSSFSSPELGSHCHNTLVMFPTCFSLLQQSVVSLNQPLSVDVPNNQKHKPPIPSVAVECSGFCNINYNQLVEWVRIVMEKEPLDTKSESRRSVEVFRSRGASTVCRLLPHLFTSQILFVFYSKRYRTSQQRLSG